MGLPWTPEELAKALALKPTQSCRQIGEQIGRSADEVARKLSRERERQRGTYVSPAGSAHIASTLAVPQDVLFSRERRCREREQMSEAALLCGDPEPSRAGGRHLMSGIVALLMLLVASFLASPADARARHYRHHHQAAPALRSIGELFATLQERAKEPKPATQHRHRPRFLEQKLSDARPHAWCGWFMRQQVGADPGPSYNLARSWAHWGSATFASIGAVVVWPHHVGMIVGGSPGHWVVKSGNDGHQVRTRELSVARAIAFREGGSFAAPIRYAVHTEHHHLPRQQAYLHQQHYAGAEFWARPDYH